MMIPLVWERRQYAQVGCRGCAHSGDIGGLVTAVSGITGSGRQLDVVLRQFRRRAGLTQREAAELAGLSVAGIRDLEQGRVTSPRSGTLRKLADALGLSSGESDELMRLAEDGRKPGSDLWIQVLGPLTVTVNGEEVDPGSTRQRTLLALLALAPNVAVGRDTLVEAVWGPSPPLGVADLLQSRVSRLRRRLANGKKGAEGAVLEAAHGGYRLLLNEGQHDLLAVRGLVARARRARDDGEPANACALFADAVRLWRGQPLADLSALQSDPAVVALTSEWQSAVIDYAEVAADLGVYEQVVPVLRQLAVADPLHETVHANLMIALAGSGQQAAALALFDEVRRRLADELGADPGPELVAAHRRVLRQEVTRPESAPASAHRQLPPDIADFTGRERELRDLRNRLATTARSAPDVVAVQGMGGVGKTRLAIRLAHELVSVGECADEQLYVDLRGHAEQPPADPATVLASFLHLLGVPGGQIPRDLEGRSAMFRDRLHGKHALVLLDNAASEEQVTPLLPASPTNVVVVTSRRALTLDGAYTVPLPTFSPDDAETLIAKIVGMERVSGDRAGVTEVVELCGRLPLAVALAARRLQTRPAWSVADLAARLRDAGNRMGELAAGSRKVRTAFDLSYRALEPDRQRLFRLLGLIPGADFTVDAAAALAGAAPSAARGALEHLVEEHLVTAATGERYRLHDLLRAYAQDLLDADESPAERQAAVTRLLDYYLHTAGRAAYRLQPSRWAADAIGTPSAHVPALDTAEEAASWLDAEYASLTGAVRLAAEWGLAAYTWRLVHSMWVHVYLYGYAQDWEQTLRAALRASREAGCDQGTAVSSTYLGGALLHLGQLDDAFTCLQEARELHRELGNLELEMSSLTWLSITSYRLGRFSAALEYIDEALQSCRGRDPYREAILRNNRGYLLAMLGRTGEAIDEYTPALTLARRAGNGAVEGAVLVNLGDAYRRRGLVGDSMEYIRHALELAEDGGLRPTLGYARHRLGNVYLDLGRPQDALACFADALSIVRAVGVGGAATECEVLVDLADALHRTGGIEEAADHARSARELATATGERYQLARALRLLSQLHDEAGDYDDARDCRRDALRLFADLGTPEAEGSDGTGKMRTSVARNDEP